MLAFSSLAHLVLIFLCCAPLATRSKSWPILLFFAVSLGGPYLIWNLLKNTGVILVSWVLAGLLRGHVSVYPNPYFVCPSPDCVLWTQLQPSQWQRKSRTPAENMLILSVSLTDVVTILLSGLHCQYRRVHCGTLRPKVEMSLPFAQTTFW
jgi:hypothetical protein